MKRLYRIRIVFVVMIIFAIASIASASSKFVLDLGSWGKVACFLKDPANPKSDRQGSKPVILITATK